MTDLFPELNPKQHQAATFGSPQQTGGVESSPLLIMAGAGTGKTMTLAHRVAFLLIHGVKPERILMLTFSRRAAREMTNRATRIAAAHRGGTRRSPVRLDWSGTFHSIANRILRSHGPRIGLDPGFSILDQSDSADLLDVLRHQRGLSERRKRFPKKSTCLAIYSRCINTQRKLDHVLERHFPWCGDWQPELKDLFNDYVEAKQKQALLDYDDLLLHWMWLCEESTIARMISADFDHILVDEYQDTNRIQSSILHALRPRGLGLCVVGDDAQSIYSFRAAQVKNILDFPGQFQPPADVITLEQNYRSTQPILDVSNTLLAECPGAYRKQLKSSSPEGQRPRLVTVESDLEQAGFVVDSVLESREGGTALRDQAVLFRSGHHSDRLEVELVRRDIPYVKYGGLKYLESAHIKDALSVLRWADNPRNRVAGFRVLKLLPGVGPAAANKALDYLEGCNLRFASLAAFTHRRGENSSFLALARLLGSIQDGELKWPGQLEQLLAWYGPYLELNYDDHFVRLADVEQLVHVGQQYPSRHQFLSELTLDPPSGSGDLAGTPHLDDDFLILSTVHSAKGQEWRNVFVLNVADGNFPNEFACGDDEAIEEERRLLYVAMTRARQSLDLIQPLKYWVPEQPRMGDKHVYGARSRFLTAGVMSHLDTHFYGPAPPNAHRANGATGHTTAIPDLARRSRELF